MDQPVDTVGQAQFSPPVQEGSGTGQMDTRVAVALDVTPDHVAEARCMDPVLELAVVNTPVAPVHGDAAVDGSDEEIVDEEIEVDSPPARGIRDGGAGDPPPAATPTVCRFASPGCLQATGCSGET
jgi:hypothetical protein